MVVVITLIIIIAAIIIIKEYKLIEFNVIMVRDSINLSFIRFME
jgi:hypothetical protein